jgi:hypothetical protein
VPVFAAGQYVAPALVWPEEQVGGVQRSFYALGPAGQLVFLVVSAFVAVLAAGVGWPLATSAGRREEAVR